MAAHTVAAAYAPTAATVAVARPAPVAVAAATAAAYGGYQPTHAATDYGYPQRQPEVPPPPPPVTSQNYQVHHKLSSFMPLHRLQMCSNKKPVTQIYRFHLQDSYSYVRSTAPAVAYDSKQYYQQPTATAAVAAAQPQPSVADSYYQTGMLNTHWVNFHSSILLSLATYDTVLLSTTHNYEQANRQLFSYCLTKAIQVELLDFRSIYAPYVP